MQTKRLFDENVMMQSCEATVQDCMPYKNGFRVVLDQTVFFPEGGGQLSDRGTLKNGKLVIHVQHVAEKDGVIYHETDQAVPAGTLVIGQLDWQERFDHMQQHCGEHMLSYAFWKLYQADNVGFHMHPDMVSIDLNREVNWQQAMEAEAMTNRAIEEDHPIHVESVPSEQAARRPLRKFNDKLKGLLRIVSVEGNDSCTCCGTHPPTSGMVGLVKVLKVERHKGGSRVSFLCGRQALIFIDRQMLAAQEASNLLSIKEEELVSGIERLLQEKKECQEQAAKLMDQLLSYEIAEMDEKPVYNQQGQRKMIFIRDDLTPRQAKALMKKLQERDAVLAAVFYHHAGRINYMIAATAPGADCRKLLQNVNEAWQGRGGGRPDACQGSAACMDGWQKQAEEITQSW